MKSPRKEQRGEGGVWKKGSRELLKDEVKREGGGVLERKARTRQGDGRTRRASRERRNSAKKARQKEKERKSRAKSMDKEVATTEKKRRDGGRPRWEGTDGVKELDQVTRSVGRVSGLAVAWLSGSAKGGGSIHVQSCE